jgi:hypothetical protein
MADNALVIMPVLESRPNALVTAVAAVRERLGRFARARPSGARTRRGVVEVGSVVRVFAVDALRERTLILAPAGWSGPTPGVISADSAIGAALAGSRVGETRRWDSPSGLKRLRIVDIVGRIPTSAWARSKELAHSHVVGTTPRREAGARQPRVVPLPEAA